MFCQTCNKEVPVENWENHLASSRHRRANKEYCTYCNRTMNAKNFQDHIKGKAHLQAKKDHEAAHQNIFVSGLTPQITLDKLGQHFSLYGQVTNHVIFQSKISGIVSFADESSASEACIDTPHVINGIQIHVRPYCPPKHIKAIKDKDQKTDKQFQLQKIKQKNMLNKKISTNEQMDRLVQEFELSDYARMCINQNIEDLEQAIQAVIPEVFLRPFGSAVNGTGTSVCDLDIVLQLKDQEIPKTRQGLLKRDNIFSVPVRQGYLDFQTLRTIPSSEMCKLMPTVLKSSPLNLKLRSYVPIHQAKIPVLKFIYHPKLEVDMTFGPSLALENTRLIQVLLAVDPRVRIVMLNLRFWLRCAGFGGETNRVTNYALFLMLYFYLQNTQPPVLPTVEQLAHIADDCKEVEGWDCMFSDSVDRIKTDLLTETNCETPAELLAGFFKFYAGLDLMSNVLSVRTGAVVMVPHFKKMMEEHAWLRSFKVESLSVQDPFKLTHNVIQNLNKTCAHQLCLSIQKGSAVVSTGTPWRVGKVVVGNPWRLIDLMPNEPIKMDHVGFVPTDDNLAISIPLVARDLPRGLWDCVDVDDMKVRWHQWVEHLLRRYLKIWGVTCSGGEGSDITAASAPRKSETEMKEGGAGQGPELTKRKWVTEMNEYRNKRVKVDEPESYTQEKADEVETYDDYFSSDYSAGPSVPSSTPSAPSSTPSAPSSTPSASQLKQPEAVLSQQTMIHCSTNHKIWTNKNAPPIQLTKMKPEDCPFTIEAQITESLFADCPRMETALSFDLCLRRVVSGCVTHLVITTEGSGSEILILKTFMARYTAKLLQLTMKHLSTSE